jgi:hypothetical protein
VGGVGIVKAGGMNEGERAALAAHPDLRRLAALRDQGGWQFMHHEDGSGNINMTTGYRSWPDGSTDVLQFHGPGNAWAWRGNRDGAMVWSQSGGLLDVINHLLELPDPAAPHAPRIVIGSGRKLWQP